jgi:hypothetical protein
MHEVTGGLALFFDPNKVNEISASLTKVLDVQFNENKLKNSAHEHAQSFDWKKHFNSVDGWIREWLPE